MNPLQPPRGTHDLIGDAARRHRHVRERAFIIAARYGFQPIETPIFEFTEVFQRSIGDTSDIVSKEMYSFPDRGGDSLTLRPENTAGVVRALISNGLTQSLPQKFFYAGPMFRYERPQKGRQRQFHQIGCELIGSASPFADVELIASAYAILKDLLPNITLRLELNTLGDKASRAAYRERLVAYLNQHQAALSDVSRERLTRNPLRILDSKEIEDQSIIAGAPGFADTLTGEAIQFYDRVRSGLDSLDITYETTPRLVRGLDYYSHTVFEFTTDQLGSQGTVLAGGRYDDLVEELGGPSTPGIGWAAGIERLVALGENQLLFAAPRPIAVLSTNTPDPEKEALIIAAKLRGKSHYVEHIFTGNLKKRLERATKLNATFAVIIGDEECQNKQAAVRNLDARTQESVAFDMLIDYFQTRPSHI